MRTLVVATLVTAIFSSGALTRLAAQVGASATRANDPGTLAAYQHARARMQDDVAALRTYRPQFPFWRYIFTIRDGAIIFGSAVDGRLIATLPAEGDWRREGVWDDPSLASLLEDHPLPDDLSDRRDELARLLEPAVGPVVHNATRGLFLRPNERPYGAFLDEWGAIYERFGVPAELGLAQAIVESGLDGNARSEARAIGFCQWLRSNWNRLKRLTPHVIEGYNQTTQAPYCAAYLSILATKYGSFIPALSEHHSGGVNVGRTLINGERLGGVTTRDRYFLGSDFARDLRLMSPGAYREVYGSYGPRSIRYAEMVLGNISNVERIRAEVPQLKIHAMRLSRAQTLTAIARSARLSPDEVRRYNPSLSRQVPADATLYLPKYIAAFGRDVAFWHRPASQDYAALLDEFVHISVSPDEWDSAAFDRVLESFRSRFAATRTEEGAVMATSLTYAMYDRHASRQGQILADFRSSEEIRGLFDRARQDREIFLAESARAIIHN